MVFGVQSCTWGKKGRLAFFIFMFPQFGNSFSFFFFFFLCSSVKCLVCALCNTAVLAMSAEQRFCDSKRSNRLFVAFVSKK